MATVKKIKKAQGGDSLAIKKSAIYKASKPTLDSAGKKNMNILNEMIPIAQPKLKAIKAKDGKWIQKATASIKRRGTEGKCTPITKPGCTGRAKALAKTFKAMAKARKK